MRILVVEDEADLNLLLCKVLTKAGYTVDGCLDGEDAQAHLLGAAYDGILLDVMLPKKDGYTLVQELRDQGNDTPVLFLTARDSVADRVKWLDLGGDDYLVKPFDFAELLARIRTTLRRADRLKMSQGAQRDVYQVQDLVVDITKHQVLLAGEQIHFTQNEFKILELLCIHAGKVLTYDFILEHVWGPYGGNNNNQILRVNMANIRRKLKEDPSKPKYIHTELGIGYRMLED